MPSRTKQGCRFTEPSQQSSSLLHYANDAIIPTVSFSSNHRKQYHSCTSSRYFHSSLWHCQWGDDTSIDVVIGGNCLDCVWYGYHDGRSDIVDGWRWQERRWRFVWSVEGARCVSGNEKCSSLCSNDASCDLTVVGLSFLLQRNEKQRSLWTSFTEDGAE